MEVSWTDEAIEALSSIFDYLSARSEESASRLITRILERVEGLRGMPFSGRMVPEYEQVQVREVIVSNYRVIYRVTGSGLVVETIVHRAADLRPDRGPASDN